MVPKRIFYVFISLEPEIYFSTKIIDSNHFVPILDEISRSQIDPLPYLVFDYFITIW